MIFSESAAPAAKMGGGIGYKKRKFE